MFLIHMKISRTEEGICPERFWNNFLTPHLLLTMIILGSPRSFPSCGEGGSMPGMQLIHGEQRQVAFPKDEGDCIGTLWVSLNANVHARALSSAWQMSMVVSSSFRASVDFRPSSRCGNFAKSLAPQFVGWPRDEFRPLWAPFRNRPWCPGARRDVGVRYDSNLVDPASSHMLVSKIKPCMSQYKLLYGETANGSLKQL